MTPNHAAALTYCGYGVRIIPVREANSSAGPAKAPYVPGGFRSATAERRQIDRWRATFPSAAYGLPCRMNGIIAIDADRHGAGDGVTEVLALFERFGVEPSAGPVVITPRDGRHFIYRRPDGLGETRGKIGSAVDVRDNAYVVAAGSVMATGGCYALAAGTVSQLAAAIASGSLPLLPQALCDLIAKPAPPPRRHKEHVPSPLPGAISARCEVDPRPRLAGLVRAVASAPPGQRNATLHWAACRAGELVGAGVLPLHVAFAALVEAGFIIGLTERETVATIRSGMSASPPGQPHGR